MHEMPPRFAAASLLSVLLLCLAPGSSPEAADASRPPPGATLPAGPSSLGGTRLTGESPFKRDVEQFSGKSGLVRSGREILGPFADVAGKMADSLYGAVLPPAKSSLHWPFLILTGLLALALFIIRGGRGAKGADGREGRRGLLEYLLPRAIYAHPSARVDVWLYLIDAAVMPLWVIAFLGAIAPWVERTAIGALHRMFGASPHIPVTLGWRLLYGLVMLLVADMCFFFYHLMVHRTRIGWAIHKVHHSAEVLTPLTRFREHFLEAPIDAGFASVGLGAAGGVFAYLFDGGITQITVMNVGIFYFLYTLNGNFRHYHVSLRYPRWLELWLQSPGMHHTHHSTLRKHWDSNLGLVTSIWDRLWGTLYIAAPHEETPWGLPPQEQAAYRTLSQNFLNPFREIHSIIRGKAAGTTQPGSTAGA